MTDYTKSTGTAGTMLIRDLGYQVQFHLRSADGGTYSGALPWSVYFDGAERSDTVVYPSGSPWVHVASYDIATTQDIRFSIGATGTMGFGGPTDFWQRIDRAAAPSKATGLQATTIGHTSAFFTWARGAMNGGSFQEDQIQISSSPQSGSGDFTGTVEVTASDYSNSDYATATNVLRQGRTYRAHVRSRNSVGWGPWSDIYTFRTLSSGRLKQADNTYREFVMFIKTETGYREAVPFLKSGPSLYQASRG